MGICFSYYLRSLLCTHSHGRSGDPSTVLGVPDEASSSSKPTLLKGRLGSMSKAVRNPKAYSPPHAPGDPIGYGHTRSCDRKFGRARSPRSNLPSQGTAVWPPRTQCIPSRVTYHLSPLPMGLKRWVCCPFPPEGGLGVD